MYNTTQIAKELGMSAQKLNKLLEYLGVQKSFTYSNRLYWELTPEYQRQGYELYDKRYAEKVDRIKLLPTLHWTEQGRLLIRSLVERFNFWQKEIEGPFSNALHLYTNRYGYQTIQLTSYDPSEPLNETRVYISEDRRKAFCQDASVSTYHCEALHQYRPSFAIDERDVGLYNRWNNYLKEYYRHYNLGGEKRYVGTKRRAA